MLRAIIVDDEELSIKWLGKILSENDDVDVCRTFLNASEAYEYARSNRIDLAFLDISMPELGGMALAALLQDLDAAIQVVFVTAYDDYALQAFDLSALDYLIKPVTPQRMAKTLDRIRGRIRLLPGEPKAGGLTRDADDTREKLTEQEKRVLRLMADGLANKEIARKLNVTGETVKSHIKNVYRKLGISNRVQALQRAGQLKAWD
ncbi:MAG: ypdB 2 [Paenibacillaceae bacterium]|nr:ypdB 2 [Paenibacillaceae bacterium]